MQYVPVVPKLFFRGFVTHQQKLLRGRLEGIRDRDEAISVESIRDPATTVTDSLLAARTRWLALKRLAALEEFAAWVAPDGPTLDMIDVAAQSPISESDFDVEQFLSALREHEKRQDA